MAPKAFFAAASSSFFAFSSSAFASASNSLNTLSSPRWDTFFEASQPAKKPSRVHRREENEQVPPGVELRHNAEQVAELADGAACSLVKDPAPRGHHVEHHRNTVLT